MVRLGKNHTFLNGELTNAKTTLSALDSKKHIVSTRDTTVNLSKSLIRGAYVDVKTTFKSVDGIIPIPVLNYRMVLRWCRNSKYYSNINDCKVFKF